MLFRRGGHNRSLTVDIRKARQAAERGEDEAVIRRCRAALEQFDRLRDDQIDDATVEALDEFVDLCSEICRYDLALEVCSRLQELDPDDVDLDLDVAICQFELTEFEAAEERLRTLAEDCDPHPEIEWYLGALAERRSAWPEALQRFLRAHELDPHEFPRPLEIPDARTETVVEQVIAELPRDVYDAIWEVPILLDPLPAIELLRLTKPPFSPLILGLHHGMDLRHDSVFHTRPTIDGIRVFPRNVAKYSRSLEQYDHEIGVTLLHEIGHRLGWNEEELWQRGL
jgi:predicted Zn-dependent protease with MMP-like domain